MNNSVDRYNRWHENMELMEPQVQDELKSMKWDTDLIRDAFSEDLKFGTSGLRGIMGAGTNRMNSIIVRKVSQAVSQFIDKTTDDPAVVIAYDTRINSFEYAVAAAEVFCGNGIPVFLFNRTVPVSMLSYAITELGASMGVMITASHNRKEYNGYKVYGAHGHQILEPIPEMILEEYGRIDEFHDVKSMDINEAFTYRLCVHVLEDLIDGYMDRVASCGRKVRSNPDIVYTPLNGAGLEFVTEILNRRGFTNIHVTESQIIQDGLFETCPYPNPEKKEAYTEAAMTAEEIGASYIIATDPDCDRFGMAVRNENGFRMLTGNEIGILMFHYLLETRKTGKHSAVYKSIVTTPLIDIMAKAHKVKVHDTLIGFKYIGEKLHELSERRNFFFGMEESHGYLIGPYTWDKDAVGASMIACEMIDYYGNLLSALDEIYNRYGYVENTQIELMDSSFEGKKKIQNIIGCFRNWETDYTVTDYLSDNTGLPEADILKFEKTNEIVYVRPSGTEPKLKIYLFATGSKKEEASTLLAEMKQCFTEKLNQFRGGNRS